MIRVRPYRASDQMEVLSWCTDKETFRRWTAGVLGEYPITPQKFSGTANTMRFVALDEQEVVGFFTIRNPVDDVLDELRIGFVIVDPKKRGCGVGKQMLKLGLKFAFDIYQARRVTLVVFEDNAPAHACYSSIGFADTGDTESYTIDGKEWTCIKMEFGA